jgi:hypothetical protein
MTQQSRRDRQDEPRPIPESVMAAGSVLPSSERPLPIEDAKQRGAAKQYQHLVIVAQLRSRLRRVEAEIMQGEWAENRRKLGYDPNDEVDIIIRDMDEQDAI